MALIARHLPVLAGKPTDEIASYPFALHDAQSVVARQHGFPTWNEIHNYIEGLQKSLTGEPTPPLDIGAKLRTVLRARELMDYDLFCSVMSEEMKVFVTKDKFKTVSERMTVYFQANYQITYMGSVNTGGRPVHFWRLWVKGWESDLLIRMVVNQSDKISGLLYSGPFDTALHAKK